MNNLKGYTLDDIIFFGETEGQMEKRRVGKRVRDQPYQKRVRLAEGMAAIAVSKVRQR